VIDSLGTAAWLRTLALPRCSFGCHYFSPFPYIASETPGGFTARSTSETCHTLMMQKMQQELFVVPPMDCKSAETLPPGDDWQYEIKFDGYRAIALKQRGEANTSRQESGVRGLILKLSWSRRR
jgi:hypothetical protein